MPLDALATGVLESILVSLRPSLCTCGARCPLLKLARGARRAPCNRTPRSARSGRSAPVLCALCSVLCAGVCSLVCMLLRVLAVCPLCAWCVHGVWAVALELRSHLCLSREQKLTASGACVAGEAPTANVRVGEGAVEEGQEGEQGLWKVENGHVHVPSTRSVNSAAHRDRGPDACSCRR
eukprot:1718809-Rhodomonas_salina.1